MYTKKRRGRRTGARQMSRSIKLTLKTIPIHNDIRIYYTCTTRNGFFGRTPMTPTRVSSFFFFSYYYYYSLTCSAFARNHDDGFQGFFFFFEIELVVVRTNKSVFRRRVYGAKTRFGNGEISSKKLPANDSLYTFYGGVRTGPKRIEISNVLNP